MKCGSNLGPQNFIRHEPSWGREGEWPDDMTYTSVLMCICGEWSARSPLASPPSCSEHTPVVVAAYMRQWQRCTSVNVNSEDIHRSEPTLRGWICHQSLSLCEIYCPKHLGSDPLYGPMRIAESLPETICLSWRGLTQLTYNNKRTETYHRSLDKGIFNMNYTRLRHTHIHLTVGVGFF